MLYEGTKLFHWNYFLALESDLEQLARYVEFTQANYNTFSLEIARLLFDACSEVEAVLKALCERIQPNSKPSNMGRYREIVSPRYPRISNFRVRLSRYGLEVKPWENWQNNKAPNWWDAYNAVKHSREKHLPEAKLEYAIKSIAGLYVVVLYLYKNEAENGEISPPCQLMFPSGERLTAVGTRWHPRWSQ
jgi:hypothetical protein